VFRHGGRESARGHLVLGRNGPIVARTARAIGRDLWRRRGRRRAVIGIDDGPRDGIHDVVHIAIRRAAGIIRHVPIGEDDRRLCHTRGIIGVLERIGGHIIRIASEGLQVGRGLGNARSGIVRGDVVLLHRAIIAASYEGRAIVARRTRRNVRHRVGARVAARHAFVDRRGGYLLRRIIVIAALYIIRCITKSGNVRRCIKIGIARVNLNNDYRARGNITRG